MPLALIVLGAVISGVVGFSAARLNQNAALKLHRVEQLEDATADLVVALHSVAGQGQWIKSMRALAEADGGPDPTADVDLILRATDRVEVAQLERAMGAMSCRADQDAYDLAASASRLALAAFGAAAAGSADHDELEAAMGVKLGLLIDMVRRMAGREPLRNAAHSADLRDPS